MHALVVATLVAAQGHPRLYFTAPDLPRLRALRGEGVHARIWRNVMGSADWCLTRAPRREWIAPVTPDPVYENLYDRFYAIMGDLAITEHLAFAYALSGEGRYGDAAREWVLASCRVWRPEAEGAPNGSKAYAVARLLKGIAVGYDAVHDRLSDAERQEVRAALLDIGGRYYDGYFTTPRIAGPEFHTHHAVVEWASFGVAALALLGEAPQAQQWLDATVRKFEAHLLPAGLAADGAQVEGATFWASTLHYRLFFMDALRRVTGRDLFGPHARAMNADLALASIAARRTGPTHSQDHETVVLEPSYGQIDYYAPVLLALAREYRRPLYQHLALWDLTLGHLQRTRYVTPRGEPLLFELGGYAYVWYDPGVPARPEEARLSYAFPSVGEAYVRASWEPGDLLAGIRAGQVVVHAGGRPVLVMLPSAHDPGTKPPEVALTDDGDVATMRCDEPEGERITVELRRRDRRILIRRQGPVEWRWWCYGPATRSGSRVGWPGETRLEATTGSLVAWDPDGHAPVLRVGYDKLLLADPAPARFPLATVRPDAAGTCAVAITCR